MRSLLQVIRRQFLIVSGTIFLGVLLTSAVIFYSPRQYQSNAKLLLRLGRENVSLDPTVTTTGDTISLHRTGGSEITTALRAMGSRDILSRVIDEIGEKSVIRGTLESDVVSNSFLTQAKRFLKASLAEIDPIDVREQAILKLQDALTIEAGKESSVVDIRYKAKSAELAQRVIEVWVNIYLDEHTRMNSTPGSLAFFEEQETELLKSLAGTHENLQSLKSQHGIVTVEGEQQILESQFQWARNELLRSQGGLAAARARRRSLEAALEVTSEKIVSSESVSDSNESKDRMRDRLYEQEIEERKLAAQFTEGHPAVQAARLQLADARRVFELQRNASSQVTEAANPLRVSLMEKAIAEAANVSALEAEVAATSSVLSDLTKNTTQLNARAAEIAVLERNVDVLETQYRRHFEKREQARQAADLELRRISNVNIIQRPSLEKRPVTPNKKLCALVGLMGSMLAAIGLVTIREARRIIDNEPRHGLPRDSTVASFYQLGDDRFGKLDAPLHATTSTNTPVTTL